MKKYIGTGNQLRSAHKQQIKRPVPTFQYPDDNKIIISTGDKSVGVGALSTTTLKTLNINKPGDLLLFFLLITAVTSGATAQNKKNAPELPSEPENHSLSKADKQIKNHVSSRGLQKPEMGSTHTPASVFYQGLLAKDISQQTKDCKKKRHGVSTGKTCEISNIKYYLKVMEPSDKAVACNRSELLGMYNLKFINQTMGITVPNVNLVYEKNGVFTTHSNDERSAELYVASQEVEHFTPGSQADKKAHKEYLIQKTRSILFNVDKKTLRRIELVKNMGESGIAKLAVAGTFCQDLVNNDDNWGYNRKGLVIVDADHSPHSLEEYLGESSRMPGNIELDFSLHTVLLMRLIYKKMLEKSPPKMEPGIDMARSFYKQLLQLYIVACDIAVSKITKIEPDLSPYKPSSIVNDALREGFLQLMQTARHDGLYSKYDRYSCDATAKDTGSTSIPKPR